MWNILETWKSTGNGCGDTSAQTDVVLPQLNTNCLWIRTESWSTMILFFVFGERSEGLKPQRYWTIPQYYLKDVT